MLYLCFTHGPKFFRIGVVLKTKLTNDPVVYHTKMYFEFCPFSLNSIKSFLPSVFTRIMNHGVGFLLLLLLVTCSAHTRKTYCTHDM